MLFGNNKKRFQFYRFLQKITFVFLGTCILSNNVWAAGDIPALDTALQALVDIMTGTPVRILAVAAVATLGFLWYRGKISMERAVAIAGGVGVIVGAPQIVALFMGS